MLFWLTKTAELISSELALSQIGLTKLSTELVLLALWQISNTLSAKLPSLEIWHLNLKLQSSEFLELFVS